MFRNMNKIDIINNLLAELEIKELKGHNAYSEVFLSKNEMAFD